jgi:hypothetical protein
MNSLLCGRVYNDITIGDERVFLFCEQTRFCCCCFNFKGLRFLALSREVRAVFVVDAPFLRGKNYVTKARLTLNL